MRSDTVRSFSRLTTKRQPPCEPRASTKPVGLSSLGIWTMGGPGVLVPTLPRCHFPWPVNASRMLKITRLSIIPSATLWDSVFQGPTALQGPEQWGKKDYGCSWLPLARRACSEARAPQACDSVQAPQPHVSPPVSHMPRG